MTLFEYLAIAFSLVLSFAVMRLVGGLPHLLRRERRYWVHTTAVGLVLALSTSMFWAYWSYRDVEWTLPKFFLGLSAPGVLFFLAATLVPENPSQVTSWRGHYYAVRFRYFTGLACLAVMVATTTTVLIGMPLTHPARLGQFVILSCGVVGAATDSPRVHAAIVGVAALLGGIFAATVFARPSSLG